MGYILSCMNGLEELLEEKFDIQPNRRNLMQALFGSSGVLGLAIGSFLAGSLMKLGRQKTMIISSIVGLCGVSLQ